MVNSKPALLYLSPVMPLQSGNGLAMRAALFLEALSSDDDIYLQIIPVSVQVDPDNIPEFVAQHTIMVDVVSEFENLALDDAVNRAATNYANYTFDIVHVMKLYLAPFANPYVKFQHKRPLCVLDLDDNEVKTRKRLSALYFANGLNDCADFEANEARKYLAYEKVYLQHFDVTIVCSVMDKEELRVRSGHQNVLVIPNAVSPVMQIDTLSQSAPTIIMVGTMGYYPNEDGAVYFCHDILPKIKVKLRKEVSIVFVGTNPTQCVRRLEKIPGVTVTGTVPEVTPWYNKAALVAVPIRAGGGTRIKILEAFAHQVPVVSTSLGAEGLAIEDGKHLFLADTAEDFAGRCVDLMVDKGLAEKMTTRARNLFDTSYSISIVSHQIDYLYQEALESYRTGRQKLLADEHCRSAYCGQECRK